MIAALQRIALRFWCAQPSQWRRMWKGEVVTRPNDEAPSGQGKGLQDTEQNGQPNFTLDAMSAAPKAWATFRADCALAGVQTWRSQDKAMREVFIVSSHGRTRDFDSLDAAEAWLLMVMGTRS